MKNFIFRKDHRDQWIWHLTDENGHTVADSAEDYHHEADCKHGAAVFTKEGIVAPVREGKKHGGPSYEYFTDHAGKWRWHFQAANNKIIADSSSKTFSSAIEVQKGIEKVRQLLKDISDGGSHTPPSTGGSGSGGIYVPPAKPAPGPKNPPYPPTDRPVG